MADYNSCNFLFHLFLSLQLLNIGKIISGLKLLYDLDHLKKYDLQQACGMVSRKIKLLKSMTDPNYHLFHQKVITNWCCLR